MSSPGVCSIVTIRRTSLQVRSKKYITSFSSTKRTVGSACEDLPRPCRDPACARDAWGNERYSTNSLPSRRLLEDRGGAWRCRRSLRAGRRSGGTGTHPRAELTGYRARKMVDWYMIVRPGQEPGQAVQVIFPGKAAAPVWMQFVELHLPVAPLLDLVPMKLNSFRRPGPVTSRDAG